MNLSNETKKIFEQLKLNLNELENADLKEHQEQSILFAWWRSYNKKSLVMFAIPNGGKRSMSVAKEMKAEGVLKGTPDIFLAYPKKGYNGLFLELKKKKGGTVSNEQKNIIERLEFQNYRVAVCKGFIAAIEIIEDYLAEV